MRTLQLWTRASNYIGEDYSDYYVVTGRHRESSLAQQHNYAVAMQRLQKAIEESAQVRSITGALRALVSKLSGKTPPPVLIDPHLGDAMVGWSEFIGIHKNAPESVLDTAREIVASLDDYYLLDEDKYTDLLSDEMDAYWERMPLWERVRTCEEQGVNIFAARRKFVPEELYEYIMQVVEQ